MSTPINIKGEHTNRRHSFRPSIETSTPTEYRQLKSSPKSFSETPDFHHSNRSSFTIDHGKSHTLSSLPYTNGTIAELSSSLSLLGPETHNPVFNVHSVVKNRNGSVLGRKTILKSEHIDSKIRPSVDFYLQGAPNFRSVDSTIYGVAQPTTSGLSSILTMLKCHSSHTPSKSCVWFSAREEPMLYINSRPFVLRDEDKPFQNITRYQGINSTRIAQMEDRLKKDVLEEVVKGEGLLLVHDEIEIGRLIPTWTAIDTVETQKEVFDSLKVRGFNVKYYRIPISPEQTPDDKYVEEYLQIIQNTPELDLMVFNCGMGIGRTTFAMVLALITRKSLMANDLPARNPRLKNDKGELFNMDEADMKNRALLRLVYVLEKGLTGHGVSHSAIDWALARCPIIEDLRSAVLGNYQCVLQLTSVIKDGPKIKRIVDEAINKCDRLINLREEILIYRVSYSVTGNIEFLEKSLGFLERYCYLLTFCAFVHEKANDFANSSFQEWLQSRPEMYRTLEHIRKKGPRLHLFRPVEDLSSFSSTLNEDCAKQYSGNSRATELERYVIIGRQGTVLVPHTILKLDQWSYQLNSIIGAANFRKIPHMDVYGIAQPTIEGFANVLHELGNKHVVWINLREEPLIYINGSPYVLRDKHFTLRNMKSYSGIQSERLEYIEEKLKEDVANEITNYDGRILLHGETLDGDITPIWEDVLDNSSTTIRQIMDKFKSDGASLDYYRVPTTAETPPEEADFDHLVSIISKHNLIGTAIVLNCQVGNGRSTTGTVVTCLILGWLNGDMINSCASVSANLNQPSSTKVTYQIIHSLLRVIKDGLECKRIVDETIEHCSHAINLRTAVETCRSDAERDVNDNNAVRRSVKKGILNLKRYFLLICFQAYLNDTSPDTLESLVTFKSWFAGRSELDLMQNELEHSGLNALIPVEQMRPGDGIALTSEVLAVVNSRNGGVLAGQTILKYDMFPGCQKMKLTLKVDGAPNYRKVPLSDLSHVVFGTSNKQSVQSSVYGLAMPTVEAIRTVCNMVGADEVGETTLLWTSLREEPVLYVNGRPYVLRLFQEPLKNIEATGIARDRVERMENQMKKDVIAESKRYNGRILLHEEMADGNHFSIVPVWETALEADVQTPLDVYNQIKAEGFKIDYLRIPITDEQAPIPEVFDQLVARLSHLGKEESKTIDSLFNCQMGRGRTTTGMVIACLMHMIVDNNDIQTMNTDKFRSFDSLSIQSTNSAEFEETRYKRGEFKIILQLISVLQHGKISKKFTDTAIDTCEHLQNLRVAIYDYKLQIEACEIGSKKYETLKKVGLNYLVRYFYLVTFADYLIEVFVVLKGVGCRSSFCDWLKERQEILNLLNPKNTSDW